MTQEELLKAIAEDFRRTADHIEKLTGAGVESPADPKAETAPSAENVPDEKPVTLEEVRTCILSIVNPQNCHQNSLFLEREFLVFVRTRFLHSEVLSGASMHAASDNFSRRT